MFRMQTIILLAIFTSVMAWNALDDVDFLLESELVLLNVCVNCTSIQLDTPAIGFVFPTNLDHPFSETELTEELWISYFQYAIVCGVTDQQAEDYAWQSWNDITCESLQFTMTENMQNVIWSADYINNLPDGSFAWIDPQFSSGVKPDKSLRKLPFRDASDKVDYYRLQNAIRRIMFERSIPYHERKRIKAELEALCYNPPDKQDIVYQPSLKYDCSKSTMDAIHKDIMDHAHVFRAKLMKPEEILKLYNVPIRSGNYYLALSWFERNLYKYLTGRLPFLGKKITDNI